MQQASEWHQDIQAGWQTYVKLAIFTIVQVDMNGAQEVKSTMSLTAAELHSQYLGPGLSGGRGDRYGYVEATAGAKCMLKKDVDISFVTPYCFALSSPEFQHPLISGGCDQRFERCSRPLCPVELAANFAGLTQQFKTGLPSHKKMMLPETADDVRR